ATVRAPAYMPDVFVVVLQRGHIGAGIRVPSLDATVRVGGSQQPAIGAPTEFGGAFRTGADGKTTRFRRGVELPDLDGSIPPAFRRSEMPAVRAPADRIDVRGRVPAQQELACTGLCIPNRDGQVAAARCQALPIRAPAERAREALHLGIRNRAKLRAGNRVPDLDGLILTGAG